ncbi:hypothetical protein F8388_022668 [Cannabis sativa]|uniref:Uncharacterized protein n=1 Tax=Cannabis sativa TaxID=3483 RepID=A0A7J6G2E5_CANSA|nr:hypothetical protein F8388_022668 [Cannabis sativa]
MSPETIPGAGEFICSAAAGRLKTIKTENPSSYLVYVDCNNTPGAKFIYSTLDLTISDILSPTDK